MAYRNTGIYHNSHLDPTTPSIRLLHLQPGTFYGPISATLHIETLEQASKQGYTCLSYVWGNEVSQETVQVNDGELRVTANLLECLRYLRHTDKVLILWIDAICINQGDLEEKSHQVSMMGRIYASCSSMYIWLGAPLEMEQDSRSPFELMQHLASNSHYSDLPGYSQTPAGTLHFQENSDFDAIWEPFLLVASSCWWTRAWTVQEAALPTDSVLCCGYWRSTFKNTLMAARRNGLRHRYGSDRCCENALEALPPPVKQTLAKFMERVLWIERFGKNELLEDHHGSTGDAWTRQGQPKTFHDHARRPFYELALTFSHRICRNPRDNIYSLLSLVSSTIQDANYPDYNASVLDVYAKAFRLMLEETECDYRCFIRPAMGWSGRSGLPSWVPDFGDVVPMEMVEQVLRRIMLSGLYNPSNGISGAPRFENERSLSVTGVQADTIVEIGSSMTSVFVPTHQLAEILLQWQGLCRRNSPSLHEDDVRCALSRVMCASLIDVGVPLYGKHRSWRRIEVDDFPTPEEWQGFVNGSIWALAEGYRTTMEMACSGRSIFRTAGGRIGLCSAKAETGDEVWVLFGSHYPFILRRMVESNSRPEVCRLIGDCFLQSIMDGEALESTLPQRSELIV